MDHPYSFWADLLSKFQGATPWIQALWLVLGAVVVVCAVLAVADMFKCAMTGVRRRSNARLVCGLVQAEQGRWLVCLEGETTRGDAFATPILPRL